MSKKLYVIKQVRGRQIREGRVVMPGTTYETFDADHKDLRFCNQLEKVDEKTVSNSYVLAKLDGVIVDAGMEGKTPKGPPADEPQPKGETAEETAHENMEHTEDEDPIEEEDETDEDLDEEEDEEIGEGGKKAETKKPTKKKSVLKPLKKK